MFLSGDSQEGTNGASSVLFFVLFSSPVDSIQALSIISLSSFSNVFSCWKFLSKHLLITNIVILVSGVLKISQKIQVSIRNPFKLFRGLTLFKPFNSTGAIYILNIFNGVSFEWALTHRSFSRILRVSSNFPGVTLKFFSKFDIRMSYLQSNAFSKIFHILFIIGSTFLFFILECLNNSWWCFSSSFSAFEDRRRVSL